jgi:hypothetical protein
LIGEAHGGRRRLERLPATPTGGIVHRVGHFARRNRWRINFPEAAVPDGRMERTQASVLGRAYLRQRFLQAHQEVGLPGVFVLCGISTNEKCTDLRRSPRLIEPSRFCGPANQKN